MMGLDYKNKNYVEKYFEDMKNGGFIRVWNVSHLYPIRRTFSKKSLAFFAKAIEQRHPTHSLDESFIALYGFYVGEVAVRTIKGVEWDYHESIVTESKIRVRNDNGKIVHECNPFQMVYHALRKEELSFDKFINELEHIQRSNQTNKNISMKQRVLPTKRKKVFMIF